MLFSVISLVFQGVLHVSAPGLHPAGNANYKQFLGGILMVTKETFRQVLRFNHIFVFIWKYLPHILSPVLFSMCRSSDHCLATFLQFFDDSKKLKNQIDSNFFALTYSSKNATFSFNFQKKYQQDFSSIQYFIVKIGRFCILSLLGNFWH